MFDRMDRMATHDPTFCDITWGAGGTTADLTLEIASKMQNMVRLAVLRLLATVCMQFLCQAHSYMHVQKQSVIKVLPAMPDVSLSLLLQVCVETMMHLTCTNMPQDKLREALDKV